MTDNSTDDHRKTVIEFNKKLFKAFQIRGIPLGAFPDPGLQLVSDYLLENGRIDAGQANAILEEVTGFQALDPTYVSFDRAFIDHISLLMPPRVAREENVFPVRHENEYVHVVMGMPQDERCIRRLESVTGSRIKPYCCNGPAIRKAVETYYKDRPDVPEPVDERVEVLVDAAIKSLNLLKTSQTDDKAMVNDPGLIRLVQHLMNILVQQKASDLHIEPRESDLRIRYRKDGVMQTAWIWPSILREGIIPRLKMLSRMNMLDTSQPQDGSINFGLIRNRSIDIRVSSLPSLYGEKLVMRILERDKKQLSMDSLGMDPEDSRRFEGAVNSPTGLILVTGPTGSGKSTTLYAVLNALNTSSVNIVTAEDPVEYKLNGLTQVSCSADSGLSFNAALRSFLRQDPDIIMVGEIRDGETADIALKAAMTGHLVLSTLHTNDAAGAINRLINMDIPAYLVASAQITVVAQRLMRRLCESCKRPVVPEATLLKAMDLDPENITCYQAVGCPECSGTGYNGRIGIYELFQVTDAIVDLILGNKPARALKAAAVEQGMTTLRNAALKKLKAGLTTLEEVLRVTMDN
ncbi:MAG: ATPase, T2SS/T4P/T4SS family [Pseudomonadota bacterium]